MEFTRRQILAYIALGAVVVAVGVRYVVLPRAAGPAGGEPLVLAAVSPAASAPGPGAEPSPAPDLVVYVCGAVRAPGVVRLPPGGRVADALELAGGATARAELAAVNLAAKVVDGQQIFVPERAAAGGAGAAAATGAAPVVAAPLGASGPLDAGAPININTASAAELEALDGVGPSTAQKIIDYRTTSGGFVTIDDIKNVPGIGDAKFAAMKDQITV